MIAALPASGGTEGEPVPLPARGTDVISGTNLEAREDKHEAFGDCRHVVSRRGPRGLGVRGSFRSTEVHEVHKWG